MKKYLLISICAILVVIGVLISWAGAESILAVIDPVKLPWTTIGSDGTVDEADLSLYEVSGKSIYVRGGKTGTLDVRYNIEATDGLLVGNNPEIKIRYKDNGSSARVVAYLREANINTDSVVTMLTFDSNKYLQKNSYQTRTISNCTAVRQFDFVNNTYFIEAALIKSNNIGMPVLSGIQVKSIIC